MSKYRTCDLFGATEIDLYDGPTWGITEPAPVATQRRRLEHSLATGFIKLQKERNPSRRTELWSELLRLATQIEKLNEADQ